MCDSNPISFMTIEALPTELLTHILQYLSPIDRLRSEQVCGRWKDASRQTWRDIQTLYIIEPNEQIYYYRFRGCTESHEFVGKEGNQLFIGSDSPKIIRCLVSRVASFIKKLIIHYIRSKNHRAILPIVSRYCHNLNILKLIKIECDEELFSRLYEHNKELHSVECRFSRNAIEALPLRNWRSLRFMTADGFCEGKIVSLLEHSEALEEFETEEYTTRVVEALLKLRHLKSLYFTPFRKGSIGVIFDVPLLNRLRNLVVESVELDAHLLCNLLQHCCQLKRLVIVCNYEVLDSVVQRKESVGNSIPVVLLEAILALPILETLELHCGSIKDDILIHLTKFRRLLLEEAVISVTNNGILQMIKKSEVLEKLVIQETGVTPEMFKELVGEMDNRNKYLEVIVPYEIFEEASKICMGSKIRLVRDMQCFRDYTD